MPVRQANRDDVSDLATMLSRAFGDDPLTLWVYGSGEARHRWTERFFACHLRRLVGQQVTWTTELRSAAALWALPNRWREGPADLLRMTWATLPGILPRIGRVTSGLERIERAHPTEPHLYLAVIGVEPAGQGRGIGTSVLEPGLELCDREGLPAYLETARERNVDFYARHGFRTRSEQRMPGGPTVWGMWRAAR
jgi:GNAT superfamily N-acetyltransferase